MTCIECGARWHLNYGLTGFHWAKLLNRDIAGRASQALLEEKLEPHVWQLMALEGLKSTVKSEAIPPKDIKIEEVVKVRCPFCNNLYDETKDRCPYCGGYR